MKLNLLKPLKRIFTALTGEETEEKNLVTIIDKIADTVEESSGSGGLEKFIVTLTPTAADLSGTMDKTVAEINEAYEAGKEIWFKVTMNGIEIYGKLNGAAKSSDRPYPTFHAQIVDISSNILMVLNTLLAGGDGNEYGVTIYALTPAPE